MLPSGIKLFAPAGKKISSPLISTYRGNFVLFGPKEILLFADSFRKSIIDIYMARACPNWDSRGVIRSGLAIEPRTTSAARIPSGPTVVLILNTDSIRQSSSLFPCINPFLSFPKSGVEVRGTFQQPLCLRRFQLAPP